MIGTLAVEAMLFEAACAPAPGLVDRFNPGAHADMDIFSFLASSSALGPGLCACALAGWQHRGPASALFDQLRPIGMQAEQAMYRATRGVNTQKGLVFLLGVLTAAAAQTVRRRQRPAPDVVLLAVAEMTRGVVARELMPLQAKPPARKLTAGERLYLAYGVTGIRGELEAGLPAVREGGLPALRAALEQGLAVNDALVQALLVIMTTVDDTTILHRHDMATLRFVRQAAQQALALGGMASEAGRAYVAELDKVFSGRRISPGGAADLLAATWFLHRLAESDF